MVFDCLLSPGPCDLEVGLLVLAWGLFVFAAKQSFSKLFLFEAVELFVQWNLRQKPYIRKHGFLTLVLWTFWADNPLLWGCCPVHY